MARSILTNRCHRYLNLPFVIEPLSYFDEVGNQLRHDYIYDVTNYTDFDAWLNIFGCNLFMGEVFYTPPYGKIPIHTDHSSYTNHVKINMSWGPEEGVTQWWKSDIIRRESTYNNGGKDIGEVNNIQHIWSNEDNCELLYEANTNLPSLVNVGILHGTNNPTPEGRWTLSFIPQKDEQYIHWDDALEIFKDYLV